MKMKFTTYVMYASCYQIQSWPSGSHDACRFKVLELENERYNNTPILKSIKVYWLLGENHFWPQIFVDAVWYVKMIHALSV